MTDRDMAVVPVEPTEAMLTAPDYAGVGLYSREVFATIWSAMLAAAPQALANRDAPGSGLGSSAKADPHRAAEGAVVGLYERIGSVRVGKGDLLDHLLVSLSEQDAAAAIEEIACLVRRPLTPNVLELVQYVSWALEEGQAVNDEHIVALLDAIKDARNPAIDTTAGEAG